MGADMEIGDLYGGGTYYDVMAASPCRGSISVSPTWAETWSIGRSFPSIKLVACLINGEIGARIIGDNNALNRPRDTGRSLER